jgi:hypothetical protein
MTVVINGYDVLIDDENFELINAYTWRFTSTCHGGPYLYRRYRSNGKQRMIFFHRTITCCPKGMLIDHINGNTLDNRKCNLRICTHQQNMKNQKRRKNNTSGYKGVSFDKRDKVYRAHISLNMKRIYLGSFKSPEDAYAAYCEASKKYHGEFGRTDCKSAIKI